MRVAAGSRAHPAAEAAAGIRHPADRIPHPAVLGAVDTHPEVAEEADSYQGAVAVDSSWAPSRFISWDQAS